VHSLEKILLVMTVVLMMLTVCTYFERIWQQPSRPPFPVALRLFVTGQFPRERRLGNAMFMFAAMIGIAKQNNMMPIIDRSSSLVAVFRIKETLVDDLPNALMALSVAEYCEYDSRANTYDAATRHLLKAVRRTNVPSNIRLCGYFQSWRYFDEYADRVRQNFEFQESISAAVDSFLSSGHRNVTRVGIHIRRGDMVSGYESGYTVAPLNYFRSAMRYFTERFERVEFIVCSDDITWCRSNLPNAINLSTTVEMRFSDATPPYVDLAILARCDHIIMSVGTFGWWAAWLANGTTIYYEDWPRPNTMLAGKVNKSDYFPSHWIAMQ